MGSCRLDMSDPERTGLFPNSHQVWGPSPECVESDFGESAQTSGQPVARSFVNLGRCPGRVPASGSVPVAYLVVVSWS